MFALACCVTVCVVIGCQIWVTLPLKICIKSCCWSETEKDGNFTYSYKIKKTKVSINHSNSFLFFICFLILNLTFCNVGDLFFLAYIRHLCESEQLQKGERKKV